MRNKLPQLAKNFTDHLSFCAYVQPFIIIKISDFSDTSPINIRRLLFVNHSWRLNRSGNELLKNHFESFDIKNDENIVITGKIILSMDSICNGPWSLNGKTITVFDSTLYFELQMFGGKLSEFVDFKNPR